MKRFQAFLEKTHLGAMLDQFSLVKRDYDFFCKNLATSLFSLYGCLTPCKQVNYEWNHHLIPLNLEIFKYDTIHNWFLLLPSTTKQKIRSFSWLVSTNMAQNPSIWHIIPLNLIISISWYISFVKAPNMA